jgi:hypothetical protein
MGEVLPIGKVTCGPAFFDAAKKDIFMRKDAALFA